MPAGAKAPAEDDLLKEIGGQLDSSKFDYTQWQRTRKHRAKVGAKKVFERPPHVGVVELTVGAGRGQCQHEHGARSSHSKKGAVLAAYEAALQKKKDEQIKILELRIRARKQTIAEYKKREAELFESNLIMRTEIEAEESEAHEGVKKLLRKYEKFRGGISNINEHFTVDITDVRKDVDHTRLIVEIDIAALQKKVDMLDSKLKQKQAELHVLLNYKDKEYPVKSLKIAELQKEIEQFKINNNEDESELQHIVETEIDKFQRQQVHTQNEITVQVTEVAMRMMHPSLKDMALQNMVMKKELVFHEQHIERLQQETLTLDLEVKALVRDPKTSIRQQMFPEFFPQHEKCTPDMEVILDIPTQEWLPI